MMNRNLTLLVALLAFAPACVSVPDPKPADWLAVGHTSPEATFRTFLTAFAAGEAGLEYECLSEDFKGRIHEEFTEIAYREYRSDLLRKEPSARYLPLAEITDVSYPMPGLARIQASIEVLWHETRVEVDLVRGASLTVKKGADVLVADPAQSLEEFHLRIPRDPGGAPGETYRVLWLPELDGISVEEFSEVRYAVDWRIDDLRVLPEP